jgi:hypothetical protein
MIRRIAMWRLKDQSQAETMRSKLLSMIGEVPSLEGIEVGINKSNSPAAFDIVFTGSFASWSALREFEVDPFHKVISAWVSNAADVRHVVDYEL